MDFTPNLEALILSIARELPQYDIAYREGILNRDSKALAYGMNTKLAVLLALSNREPTVAKAFAAHQEAFDILCAPPTPAK